MKYLEKIILLYLFAGPAFCFGQSYEYPYQVESYDFIRYDLNHFNFYGDSSSFMRLYGIYDDLIRRGTGKLNIVHIGGSHIQADIYSDRMRKRLQTFQPGINGGRGFVFPYSIAGTNNPQTYRVTSTGNWENCRNVEKYRYCTLGLSGISVTTYDTTASLSIALARQQETEYDFNLVRIFTEFDSSAFRVDLHTNCEITDTVQDKELGFTLYTLDGYTDSLRITFHKTDSLQQRFVIYGLSLETDDPGVVYHSTGINGAKISSYLRCNLLTSHLEALKPDWVILSLGTNDAYSRYFNPGNFRLSYDSLILIIRQAVPDAAILLTVPNDSYLYRRYINRNTEKIKQILEELGAKYHCAVWDFFSIMGGLNSIMIWQQYDLAKRDRIHFTTRGYLIKGDLFFNAFLRSYDHFLDANKHPGAPFSNHTPDGR